MTGAKNGDFDEEKKLMARKQKVLTLTLSPALDVHYHTVSELDFEGEKVFRTSRQFFEPGGKGYNTGRALRQYAPANCEILNIVLLGGFTGKTWSELATGAGDRIASLESDRDTRMNFHLTSDENQALKVNAQAGQLDESSFSQLLEIIETNAWDYFVIAGKFPTMPDPESLNMLLESLHKNEGSILIDTSGDDLEQIVEFGLRGQDIVKINRTEYDELSEMLPDHFPQDPEMLDEKNFSATMIITDGEGPVFGFKNEQKVTVDVGSIIDNHLAVGAGDYFNAGMIASILEGQMGLKEQIQMGMAFSLARLKGLEPAQDLLR